MQQSSFFLIISTISILCPSIHAQRELFQPCPLLGPFVPAPIIDSSSPSIKAATESVNKLLDKYIVEADGRFGPISPNTTSFSIALFAGSNYIPGPDDLPFFYEYHHTASNMAGDGLDKDSVFALGDLTQLFTVYTQLAELGDQVWSHSIVDFLPELRDVSTISSDAIHAVHWEDVTLGSLAGHVAGIARDSNACTIDKVCDRDTFIPALAGRRPVTLPDSTPIASNAAFQALAFAVQTQTKQPFAQVFRDRISTPLGLNATHFLSDEFPLSLFGNGLANSTLKGEPASLGLLSTISDLATAGRAMLTSKLLPPSTTRRWLKPFTSTSNLRNAVGRPWEIYHYGSSPTDPIIDIYTKTGSLGRYSSYFGLVPSHDVGFAILAVDTHKEAPDLNAYADITLGAMLQIDTLARAQANTSLAGSYTSTNKDTNLTSHLTLTTTPAHPGLKITTLLTNATNHLPLIARKAHIANPPDLDLRLYPTALEAESKDGKKMKMRAFRAVAQDMSALVDAGTPTCDTWRTSVDVLGGEDEFVFVFGEEEGVAVAVRAVGLGVEFRRE